jgi:ribonuclease HI
MHTVRIRAALRRLAERGVADGVALSPGERHALLAAADLIGQAPSPGPRGTRKGTHLIVNIDGAARGNPGPAGIGVVIRSARGALEREVWRSIGEATNNVAEYEALLLALREAAKLKPARVTIRSDSELLVRQIEGRYRVRHPRLVQLHLQARELMRALPALEIVHVRREENARADALANRAIDEALGG